MDLLPRAQLHARQGQQPVSLGGLAKGGAIAAGIVVGEGRGVQPGELAHAGDGGRRHSLVPTGGEAGVKVKIEM